MNPLPKCNGESPPKPRRGRPNGGTRFKAANDPADRKSGELADSHLPDMIRQLAYERKFLRAPNDHP